MAPLTAAPEHSRPSAPPPGSHRRRKPPRGGQRRRLVRFAPVALAGLAAVVLVASHVALAAKARRTATATSTEVSLWSASTRPADPADPDGASVELGTSFRSSQDGTVAGIRFYKFAQTAGPNTGHLWDDQGRLLASASFPAATSSGWQTVRLDKGVAVQAGRWYVVSYHAPAGHYADDQYYFGNGRLLTSGVLQARAGLYAYGTQPAYPTLTWRASTYYADVLFAPTGTAPIGSITPTPSPTATAAPIPSLTPTTAPPTTTKPAPSPTSTSASSTSPAPSGGWPDSTNTGVPKGTTLSAYKGSCTITSTVTITAVDASNCSAILIRAAGVVIRDSLLPRIDATDGGKYSVIVSDSTVQAGSWSDGAVWGYNITATRLNITGGQHSFHCNDNCTVTDSWLHDQYNPSGQAYHNNAFITNGGTNMVVRHNTLHCTAILNSTNGGCTADVSLFGDFDPVSHVTIDSNLLKSNTSSISYCAYGGYQPNKTYSVSTYIVFENNVFERGTNGKCGVFGAVTSFQSSATGNVWTNNKWDDGTVLGA
jgi:Domain of unknown function (DUF4082)